MKYQEVQSLYGVSICALNIRSVVRKLDDIKHLLAKSNIDYLTLNKSWLNFSIDNKELEIPGFDFHRFDHDNGLGHRGGGGSLTYFSTQREFEPKPD